MWRVFIGGSNRELDARGGGGAHGFRLWYETTGAARAGDADPTPVNLAQIGVGLNLDADGLNLTSLIVDGAWLFFIRIVLLFPSAEPSARETTLLRGASPVLSLVLLIRVAVVVQPAAVERENPDNLLEHRVRVRRVSFHPRQHAPPLSLKQIENLTSREAQGLVDPPRVRRLTPQLSPRASLRGVDEPVVHEDVRLRGEQRLRGAARDEPRRGAPVQIREVRVNATSRSVLAGSNGVVEPPAEAG